MLTPARFYAERATDVPIYDDRLLKVIRLALERPFTAALDIGCGRGTLIDALREKVPQASYTGIEVSGYSATIAASKGIKVARHDLADPFPFQDETFDMVILGEVIEHLFDPDSVLDEIRRVLRPGGRLIVTTPNLVCWINRVLVPAGFQPIFTEPSARRRYGFFFKVFGQGSAEVQGHIRVMTTTALLEFLGDRGYSIRRVLGYRFFVLDKTPIARIIDGFFSRFPALASGVVVVAEKSLKNHRDLADPASIRPTRGTVSRPQRAEHQIALELARVLQRLWRTVAGPESFITQPVTSLLRLLLGNYVRLNVDGHPFTVDLRDTYFALRMLVLRTFEPEESALLVSVIRPGDHLVDIGAHIGYYSVLFGRSCGASGKVLAVEPHPDNIAVLKRNLKDNGLERVVEVVAAAAGESNGSVALFEQRGGNRADNRLFKWAGAGEKSYDVTVRTIDDLVAGWESVDVIKLDAQGYELPVIAGMRRTLERNGNVILLVEFEPAVQRSAGFKPSEMLDALLAHGFELQEVLPQRLRPVNKDELIERLEREQRLNPGADWLFSNILCARPGVLEGRGLSEVAGFS